MSQYLAQAAHYRPPALSEHLRDHTTGALGADRRRKQMSISETGWTPALVAERLAEAADVLARLPEDRVRGFYDLWPRIIGAPCRASSLAAAMPESIDRMDEALGWLCWLDDEERRLVWLRVEGLCHGSASLTGLASAAPPPGSAGRWLCSKSQSG